MGSKSRMNSRRRSYRNQQMERLRDNLAESWWIIGAMLQQAGGKAVLDPKAFDLKDGEPEIKSRIEADGIIHLSLIGSASTRTIEE